MTERRPAARSPVSALTHAALQSLGRSEFNAFLYAPLDERGNDKPLGVLSALARINVDPWPETAKLNGLPWVGAVARLAAMIAAQPGGFWSHTNGRK
jgi:hypothetical protein